jgi:signal transduction histidine kinase
LAHLLSSIELIAAGKLDFVITITGKCDFFKLSKSIDTLRRKALELQESNIQLQRFSYVVAHDLKSPLNAIQILATWIDDDEKNILTEQSRQHLQLLQTRITRLNRLLSDLLDYACVDKAVPLPCMLNISQIVRDQGKLTSPLGDFTVEYTGITEPVFLPLTIVEQCIANLISNAVKHHDRPFGKIGVNAEIAMNELMIEVLDDGPGIPPEYQNRIFKIFETLRPRDEIEGSGVGLAVVKRLVEIANGRIDMVSDPTIERGTRFRIFFPIC